MKKYRAILICSSFVLGLGAIGFWMSTRVVTDYQTALNELGLEVQSMEKLEADQLNSWMASSRLAEAYKKMAKLSGEYHWYGKAESALQRAFQKAPKNAGPFKSQAALSYTLHRIDKAEEALNKQTRAFLIGQKERAEIAGLRGDIAFQRQDFGKAEDQYIESLRLDRSVKNLFRLAYLKWQTGDFIRAENLIVKANQMNPKTNKYLAAWLDLQLGLMDLDRGRHEDALKHYKEADKHFSGYWLIKEHIAEIYALQEKWEVAEEMYTDLVSETQSPEFMDALANVYENTNQPELAKQWVLKARVNYLQRLEDFESATLGHALEHFLTYGDKAKALELAKRNHKLRPNSEASLMLAKAYINNGSYGEAKLLVTKLLDTPYQSLELDEVVEKSYLSIAH